MKISNRLMSSILCGITFWGTAIGASKVNEKNSITIDAGQMVGKIYNFWDVRALNSPEKWLTKMMCRVRFL